MEYNKYSTYQDTYSKWLPSIPKSWQYVRLGQFFSERNEKVSDKDYPPLSVTMNGIVPQLETAAKTDAGDNRKKVCKGDFVINSRSDRKGSSGLSTLDGSVSLISIVLKPNGLDGAYVHHLLRSKWFQEEFYRFGKGIVDDLWSTKYSDMKSINIPIPSLNEQQAIATFLDRETTRIDALIEKKQRLIELLKEKRQVVITQAVTKGLDPNVPMKDSGVEWLGVIPEAWERVPLKRLVSIPIIDGPHETPIKREVGIPFVSAEAIRDGYINHDKIWGYISHEDHAKYSKRYLPKRNDIFVVKLGATTGVSAIVDTDANFNIWVPLAAIRCNSYVEPSFVLNVLRSCNVQDAIKLSWTYGTQQTLGLKTLEKLFIPLPPVKEQKRIVVYLQERLPTIDKLIDRAEESVILLQEHRSALITAAVTGQIDVRNLA